MTPFRMTYLCIVDWHWIKQRPQFLAEALSSRFEMDVLYPYRNDRRSMHTLDASKIAATPYFTLPTFGGRLRVVKRLNNELCRAQVGRRIRRFSPDVLWLSHPSQFAFLPKGYRGLVVYDCMDDYMKIEPLVSQSKSILQEENSLMRRVDVVFASSQHLLDLMEKRYPWAANKLHLLRNGFDPSWKKEDKLHLLRNGFDPNWKKEEVRTESASKPFKMGYFGTLGRWFDFPLMLHALERFPEMECHLYGPTEADVQPPKHARLFCHGALPHEMIPHAAETMDALVMPFIPCDIVESVDPVKLYEYVFLHKRILAVQYDEILRFAPFVYFYQGEQMFMNHLEMLLHRPPIGYSVEEAEQFLAQNDWRTRADAAASMVLQTMRSMKET